MKKDHAGVLRPWALRGACICLLTAALFLSAGSAAQAKSKLLYPAIRPLSYSTHEKIPGMLKFVRSASGIYRVLGMYRFVNYYKNYLPVHLEKRVKNFSRALEKLDPPVKSYLYLVESSRTHPAALKFEMDSPAYKYLKQNLKVNHFGHLKYNTFRQYCNYFYSTDHHWNYKGSYRGYVDIVRMLKGADEELLRPDGVLVFPVRYNGSYARKSKVALSREHFAIYHFPKLPKYTAIVNGKRRQLDRIGAYTRGMVSDKRFASHYGLCYGGDKGMVVMKNRDGGQGNLLIICNSQSNAVKPLLIQHFKQIVSIDLRSYAEDMGKPFSLRDTVKQYKIDQILFLGDITLFKSGDLMEN